MAVPRGSSAWLRERGVMYATKQKLLGAYYTPNEVVYSLVGWVVRKPGDRMLDPACGDGRFLRAHLNSVGVEHDEQAAADARSRAPGSSVHAAEFFSWAGTTPERFECVAGNPPFIRYQRFCGDMRRTALRLCGRLGVRLPALSSSWAPFVVATSSLLKPGGRLAFVVPAEIGHARYAKPVLEYLVCRFSSVSVTAIREKLFPELSEDCWLLYAEDYGGHAQSIRLAQMDAFRFCERPPRGGQDIQLAEWKAWDRRLRPFLAKPSIRRLYADRISAGQALRLGETARVGIGYVSGANDFFHLRPSVAARLGIPNSCLWPSVRSGRFLVGTSITRETVAAWRKHDEPVYLLRLARGTHVPKAVQDYLDSPAGLRAREAYKCRNRDPWYVVPDVTTPDGFLSCMTGNGAKLVANAAGCVGTNSVHLIKLIGPLNMDALLEAWYTPLTSLSCELEGHPLGGGMLKLEPREACRVLIPLRPEAANDDELAIREALALMRSWRHSGNTACEV